MAHARSRRHAQTRSSSRSSYLHTSCVTESIFADARLKLDWARRHLETVVRECEAAREMMPFRLELTEPDANRWVTAMLTSLELPLPAVPLAAADFVNNLRSALDYTVTAAVEATPGLDLTSRNKFPLISDRRKFENEVVKATGEVKPRGPLGGLSGKFVDVIVAAQPFQPTAVSAIEHIVALSNTDKHRRLLVAGAIPFTTGGELTFGPKEAIRSYQRLKPYPPFPGVTVEVAKLRLNRRWTVAQLNVKLGTEGTVTVLAPPFGDSLGSVLPVSELEAMFKDVTRLIDALETTWLADHGFSTP